MSSFLFSGGSPSQMPVVRAIPAAPNAPRRPLTSTLPATQFRLPPTLPGKAVARSLAAYRAPAAPLTRSTSTPNATVTPTSFGQVLGAATRPSANRLQWTAIRPARQADVAEYATRADAARWGGSSCSAASLTAVLRAAGQNVNVGKIVDELTAAGGITVAQGLVSRPALVASARRHGLAADDGPMSLDQLASHTRDRGPVLVDVTNGRFPAGHWLVVTGADASGVSVVDSSGYQLTRMSRDEFLASWSGRGIRLAETTATSPGKETTFA